MRKILLLLAFIISSAFLFAQNDTLTGWTFPSTSGPDSLNANLGTTTNQGYDLRFQWDLLSGDDTTVNTIYFTEGASSFAAATDGWENGENSKYWSVKFKAPGYTDFKVSSKQRSTLDPQGPLNFNLQWRLSEIAYEDIPGGAVIVSDDWITGVVDNLDIPISNQGTSSIYVRWIVAGEDDNTEKPIASEAISMIDDILITGRNTLGVEEIIYSNVIHLFPNPNNGSFRVTSTVPWNHLSITDMTGKVLYLDHTPSLSNEIGLDLSSGTYLLNVTLSGSDNRYSTRFTVR
ncbi:MAG: T9SS type A sorting domain-containing protein [Bacteroidales bacterium]|nr:T9SS type A sorting domain-containing protein [Bacteroidales bacterium]